MRKLLGHWGIATGNSLGRRIAIAILMFSSVVTLVSTVFQLALDYQREVGDIETQMVQIQASYQESLSSSLWVTSIRDLELQLNGIMRLPDMQYGEVRTDQDILVAKAGQAISSHVIRHEFSLSFNHRKSQVHIGKVILLANLEGVYHRLRDKVVVILISQTIKTFLVSLFILMLFQYMIGRHLKKIASFSDRLFAGGRVEELVLERKESARVAGDELEQVVNALNSMQQRLDRFVAELQESEFRWKFALEGAGDGVWDLNLVTNEVIYSRRWKEMLGYTEVDELPGTLDTYTRLAHPEDSARAFAQLDDNLSGKTDFFSIEQRMLCKDGSWKWVMSRGMVVAKNAEGQAIRMIGTHTDISEQLQAAEEMRNLLAQTERARAELRLANDSMEKQVQERTAQLEAANKELEAFSYSVSHDLRSPLRGIDGWSLALQEDYGVQLDATGQEYLERVRAESQRMGQLIDDMLQFSRLGRAALNMRDIDLTDLALTVTRRIQENNPGRQFDFIIAPGLHAWGDRRLLEVVLTNLLENAAKFSKMKQPAQISFGSAEVEEPSSQEKVFAYFVQDNGAGFDMQYAHKLFGVFQRLHKASEFGGTGIGLATVQRIISRHGGRIWADAKPGAGAIFYFTLKGNP
ncbi:PAS domain-containing protein [Undibacterium sp. TS12]|uniref:PAS domain-containing protein n=1 Tax=Undibacterium sp. TS12 TaxID=2908202 RepID=UPI001F4C84AA|nr:PAS domain-containing protein [Undibacterium sp. TS12]MCH8618990.1 PAS domain-containing protein [Undibacterium sp. TS12]